jgi:hypothetical protein
MQQERLLAADSRLPLPAPLALSLLNAAAQLRKHLTWAPPSRNVIARFMALLAVCTNYAFFCRVEYGVRCLTHDMSTDHPDKFGYSSERHKATSDEARPTKQSWLYQSPPTPPSPTSWNGIARNVPPIAKKIQQPPTSLIVELRTLREFMRLSSDCCSLRMAPRRLHRHRRHTSKRFQMDIAQPPQRCRLRC